MSRAPEVFEVVVLDGEPPATRFDDHHSGVDRQGRPMITRRAWRALAVGCIGFSLMSFNTTAMNLAFGDIGDDFPGASQATVSWVASIFFIGLASLMLLSGALADRLGRLRMFRLGLLTFTVGAALSALAPSVYVLIGARLIAAAGGAMVVPSSLAVVLPEFPKERHFTAVALWSATGPVASAAAPASAAVILEFSNWRVLLAVSAPIALLAVVLSYGALRESKAERASTRIDAVGVVLGSLAIAALVFAVSQGSNLGWTSPLVLGAILATMTLLPMFVASCRRAAEPLLNLDLFLLRPVWVANTASLLLNLSGLGMWIMWPLWMERVWDYDKVQIGMGLLPGPILSGIISASSAKLADMVGEDRLLRWGSVVPVIALGWPLVFLTEEPNYWIGAAPCIGLFGAGWALIQPPLNNSVIRHVSPDFYAEVNAAFNTIRNIAGALGIAIAIAIIGDPDRLDVIQAYGRAFLTLFVGGVLVVACLVFLFPRTPEPAADAESGAEEPAPA